MAAAYGTVLPRDFDCLKSLIATFDTECGKMDDYSLQYVKHFVLACESRAFPMDALTHVIKSACSH